MRKEGGLRLGYRTAGKPAPYVEDFLVERLGVGYAAQAIDRKAWVGVREALTRSGSGLRHYSNRLVDFLGGGALMQRKVDDFEVADVATKMGLQIQQISFCFGEMPM